MLTPFSFGGRVRVKTPRTPAAIVTIAVVLAATPAFAQVPGAPLNLTTTINGTTVTLAWSPPTTGGVPLGYTVEAAFSPAGAIIATLQTSGTTLTVPNVPNGVYYVRVRAINAAGQSAPSNEVVVAVSNGCPAPPQPPDFTVRATGFNVSLSWQSSGGCAPTSYTIIAGTAPGLSNVVVANLGGLPGIAATAPAGTYYLRVVGTNAYGSAVSQELVTRIAANAQTDTLRPNGAVSFDLSINGTYTYQGVLLWDDPTIDLDLYFTTATCAYPPTSCLLAISDTTGTVTEQVTWPVQTGEPYRLWVDNFGTRTTAFTIFHTNTAAGVTP